MNTRARITRLFSAAIVGFCLQPLMVAASAQPSTRISIDSVSKHLRSHPKPKKSAGSPVAAAKAAPAVKGKREVPAIIGPAVAPVAAQPAATRTTVLVAKDSTPRVRRAPKVAKSKPPR
jgi:hypothetical protein